MQVCHCDRDVMGHQIVALILFVGISRVMVASWSFHTAVCGRCVAAVHICSSQNRKVIPYYESKKYFAHSTKLVYFVLHMTIHLDKLLFKFLNFVNVPNVK